MDPRLLICLAVAAALVAPLPAQTAPAPAKPKSAPLSLRLEKAPADEQPAPVVGWSETRTRPRPLRIHFLKADLRSPRIEPCVILAADPDGAGPAEAALTKPAALVRAEPRILAAVNANAFAHLPGANTAEQKRGWYPGKPVDIQGIAAANGNIRSPHAGGRTDFWFDPDGKPHLGPAGDGQSVRHAVADWGDLLVRDGRTVAKPDAALHPRTLAGFDATSRWLWLVVVDGRNRGTSEGMTLTECAALMTACGCANAINLDGGGSSILLQKDPAKPNLTTINRPSDGSPRAIPVMLGVREK